MLYNEHVFWYYKTEQMFLVKIGDMEVAENEKEI